MRINIVLDRCLLSAQVWFVAEKTICIVCFRLTALRCTARAFVGLLCTALPIGGVKIKSNSSNEVRAIWPVQKAMNHYKVVDFVRKSI